MHHDVGQRDGQISHCWAENHVAQIDHAGDMRPRALGADKMLVSLASL